MNKINQNEVLRLFKYNSNGSLERAITINNKSIKGAVVGCDNGNGYLSVMVKGVRFRVHRLIFLYHHGYFPDFVDHIDGDNSNNMIENLRSCSKSQNSMNRKLGSTNKSGVKGVSFCNKSGKWRAEITIDYKRIYIGEYKDLDAAKRSIEKARNFHHKEFANHGE